MQTSASSIGSTPSSSRSDGDQARVTATCNDLDGYLPGVQPKIEPAIHAGGF
jgi:hypothetical protein